MQNKSFSSKIFYVISIELKIPILLISKERKLSFKLFENLLYKSKNLIGSVLLFWAITSVNSLSFFILTNDKGSLLNLIISDTVFYK